jgi:hypothetical protein
MLSSEIVSGCYLEQSDVYRVWLMQPEINKSSSVWDYKPWWCQPWSIFLTGVTLIGGSWIVFKIIWVTVLVAIPILAWMGFFLLIYPRSMAESGVLQMKDESDLI